MSDRPQNTADKLANFIHIILDGPVTWFRESVVEPNRPVYYYYHRKNRRVPTIDECEVGDITCKYESDQQFKRDKKVEEEIVNVLRRRYYDCLVYERPDQAERCKHVHKDFKEAELNWFIKYGDLGPAGDSLSAFMKQKHRLIWERRQAEKNSKNVSEE